mgnify:FL=1
MTQTKRPNYVLWMLCVFMLLSAASYFFRPKEPEISYAEVVQLFEQEKVKSFTVQDTTLTLKLREAVDGKTELRKELYDFDLFYDDLNDLVVEQKAAGILEDYNYSANHSPNYLAIALPYVIAVAGLFAIWYFFSMRASGGGNDRMAKFGNATFRHGSESARKTTFADVAGADEEKEELAEIVDFLRDPQRFVELGARIPKGVLLVGPPGTGKTLLARAVAGEAGVEFLSISGSDFVEMYVGVGASRVRDLFEQAKKAAPCIIFIDEIDAVGRQRGTGLGGGHDEREQTLNQLLVEMDGFTNNEGVIVMAATNRADILDNALLRPGRFDRRVYMGLPDIKGREEILKVHARGKPLGDDVDLKSIARGTAGFAGADLENLLNEAAILATRSKRRFIMQADIDEAILKVVMGPEKKSRVVSERARRLTAYHESGHAIASFFLKNSDPVHYITIIPRGAAGGFTWYRKAEDAEDFTSRGEMFDSIVSALGGRIAEQLFLDDISTGASNDIQQATNIARDMVMKYGMSEKLGPISFDDSSHSIFIGRDFGTTKSYSEETAATIDEEVKHLFDQAYAKCEALLREHADLLTGLAEYLLIHETIEGDDFRYYCEHGVMPVHPDDTIEPPAKVIRRMDEAPETPQPDAEAPAQPEAPSAPDADAPNSDPGEQP